MKRTLGFIKTPGPFEEYIMEFTGASFEEVQKLKRQEVIEMVKGIKKEQRKA